MERTYPTDLPEGLTKPIKTLKEAKAWIGLLVKEDLLFHFEDGPDTIIHIKTGVRTFTEKAAKILADRVDELYGFKWGKHDCPIGYALYCENPDYGKE